MRSPDSREILTRPAPPADERLAYGPNRLHFGDLRLPSEPPPWPLAIVVHGGYWRARYDLTHIGHLCAALREQGIATWNIEYRRLGQAGGGWPGTFLDVADAADYVRVLASRFPFDLERAVVVGHSAGGHLALWLAGRHRLPESDPLYRPDPIGFAGALSLAGIPDLKQAWQLRLSDGVVGLLLGGDPDEEPRRYTSCSPAELLPLGLKQFLIHGIDDTAVPIVVSEAYRERALGVDPVELLRLPGTGHFELIDPASEQWPQVSDAVLRLARPSA